MIGTFLREHYKIIIVGLIGVIVTFIVNYGWGKYQNKALLSDLMAELKKLEDKQKTSKLTLDEEQHVQYLKGEIYILQFKCK